MSEVSFHEPHLKKIQGWGWKGGEVMKRFNRNAELTSVEPGGLGFNLKKMFFFQLRESPSVKILSWPKNFNSLRGWIFCV